MKPNGSRKKVTRNVAKALADVPIDNKQERDTLRTRIRQKYDELEELKEGMRTDVRRRFAELGDLMDLLEACESRPPETRSSSKI
jgi:hypothetical protein